jgi:hypothetical protein
VVVKAGLEINGGRPPCITRQLSVLGLMVMASFEKRCFVVCGLSSAVVMNLYQVTVILLNLVCLGLV